MMAWDTSQKEPTIEGIHSKFKLRTIVHCPGLLGHFGMSIRQDEEIKVWFSGDENMQAINLIPISRELPCELNRPLNSFWYEDFDSVYSSVGCMLITWSPLFAYF